MDDPIWRQFEFAVARFLKALDPTAVIRHNISLPDIHTGHPRQRDVWIEAKVCQHFPIKILVSCKRWNTKLNEQDIDTFVGELQSSGAHKGVLYSFSGYTKQAIKKAKKIGVCCCSLYTNQPPDLPELLIFRSYCCTPKIHISLVEIPDPVWLLKTFNDLFALELGPDGTTTLLDHLVTIFYEQEEKVVKEALYQIPSDWKIIISISEEGKPPLEILST